MAASVDLFTAQPAGLLAGRYLRCQALAYASGSSPLAHVRDDWSNTSRVKAALGAVGITGAGDAVQRDFLGQVRPLTLLGRLPGLALRSFGSRALVRTAGAAGAFVPEGKAARIAGLRFTRGTRMEPHRVAAFDVVTRETLMGEPNLDAFITAELAAGVADALDGSMLDPTNDGTGSGGAPAAITYNAPSTAASGDANADVKTLIAGYSGDLRRAAVILHPQTSVAMGLALQGSMSDTRLGITGGMLAGIPAIASEGVPLDSNGASIIILDVGALAAALEIDEVLIAPEASVEMDTAPVHNSTTPTGASLVSLFQTNSIGIKAEGRVDWQLLRADAVFRLIDADYDFGS